MCVEEVESLVPVKTVVSLVEKKEVSIICS